MKLLTISVLGMLATLPMAGQDQATENQAPQDHASQGKPTVLEWVSSARQTQARFRETKLAEAAESGKRTLQIAKRFGSSDPKLASTYHLLGLIYREWGHCGEARSNYAHAIAIWKRQTQPTPQYIFTSIANLISVLSECDDFDAAAKAFRTYKPDLERYRSNALDDARILSMRAVLARGRNDFSQAETLFRETVELMEKTPDASPRDIAGERSNLAVIYEKQGRHAEALAESERAIAFFEQAGMRHPALVASLNNAACSLAGLGRKDQSERMFERAMKAAADLYGEDNLVTAKIMLSYARLLRETKQAPAAEALQKKGSEAFRRSLARDHGMVDAEELRATAR